MNEERIEVVGYLYREDDIYQYCICMCSREEYVMELEEEKSNEQV